MISDEIAVEPARLAAHGIHDPGFMPFSMPRTRAQSPELERQALQYWWRCRAETGLEHQGRGLGKEMRLATLTVGFVGFEAQLVLTNAWHDNGSSLGVTRRLGYQEQGWRRAIRDDAHADRLLHFAMPRAQFDAHLRRDDIELVGVEAVRELLEIPA